jgi:hypothetical protein
MGSKYSVICMAQHGIAQQSTAQRREAEVASRCGQEVSKAGWGSAMNSASVLYSGPTGVKFR